MITILATTKTLETVQDAINSVERLHELVTLDTLLEEPKHSEKIIRINNDEIHCDMDWFDTEPPYLFPAVPFNQNNLLALVFYKLGNEQQAFTYIKEEDQLFAHLLIATHLKYGYEINEEQLKICSAHNKAVVCHYGNLKKEITFDDLEYFYRRALEKEASEAKKCYSAKQYTNLLLDAHEYKKAATVAAKHIQLAPNQASKIALRAIWSTAKTKSLALPYNEMQLLKIAAVQVKCIDYLLEHQLDLNAALLAVEATDVSNYLNDFPTAKHYINTAIKIFKEHHLNDFLGEAGLKKAQLLYHWSKNGSPQYYKAAINAFQDVLKIFKRDSHPDYFAEIQHSLALIYSEIPASPEEKPMWTAFCASAFKEALHIFTKEEYPYEHAMVCHNYATALMEFPPAKLHNNHEKANTFFEAALEVRTASQYPTERALTLLNQLALGWLMHNEDGKAETERLEQMQQKAEEVLTLVTDENLLAQAKAEIEKLEELKTMI